VDDKARATRSKQGGAGDESGLPPKSIFYRGIGNTRIVVFSLPLAEIYF